MADDGFEGEGLDLLILGGGPAGYTAGLYGARAELDTVILEGPNPGGQVSLTDLIENYPGLADPLPGGVLAETMRSQATRFGARLLMESATALERLDDGHFAVETDGGRTLVAPAVIVATGAASRRLGVEGEERLTGRGVSYCATCDAPFFRGREVVVVGGGDSAVKEALHLARFASRVTIVHRRDTLRAEKVVQRRAFAEARIGFRWNQVVEEVLGEDSVRAVRVRHLPDGGTEEVPVDGVFVFIGSEPRTEFLRHLGILDGRGRVVTDGDMRTSIPGLFAAGDVRAKALRQVVTAAGDGAAAAFSAQEYLEGRGRAR